MPSTSWKPVTVNGVTYEVTKDGRVRVAGKELTICKWDHSSERFVKYQGQQQYVHRLVAMAYLPRPSPKHTLVLRKDGNPSNSHLDNLYWATRSELSRSVKKKFGVNCHSKFGREASPLDVHTVRKIKADLKEGRLLDKQIAFNYGISNTTLWRIKTGKSWADAAN